MSYVFTRVGDGLRHVLNFLVAAALFAIVILVCIQVFSRYFIGAPTPKLAEFSRILFIWMTFLGAALLVSRRELIVIDLLHDRLKSGLLARLRVMADIVTAIFLITLAFYTRHLMIVVGQKIAPATGITFEWFYGGLLAFSIVGLFFTTERLFFRGRAAVQTGELPEHIASGAASRKETAP